MPAAPARAPAMRKVSEIVRLTSMPMRPDASRSWAVARIALPWRVLATNQRRASSSGIVTPATNTSSTPNQPAPLGNVTRSVRGRTGSTAFCDGPSKTSPTFWSTNDMPIALIRGARRGALRKGR